MMKENSLKNHWWISTNRETKKLWLIEIEKNEKERKKIKREENRVTAITKKIIDPT